MKFGLSDKVIEKMQLVFESNSKVDKAIVFGSRAKGNFKEGSDIDIAIKGQELSFDDVLSLTGKLDYMPYEIDLVNYHIIKEPALTAHIDRVGIDLYSRWKKIKIEEIVESANTGLDAIKRAPIVNYDSGVKCLRIQDVSQAKEYEDWGFCKVEERNFKKFQLKKNEILIARTGASIGVNKFIEHDFNSVFNNGLIRIRVNENKCLPKFLFYNFRTPYYNSFIESISGGTSTQPNMQINALLSFEIDLPPLTEQKSISETLSSLDDKIDLLNRQNKTVEQLAETLFRQWFVEEADESWKVAKLGDVLELVYGKTMKEETRTGIGFPVVGSSGVVGYHSDYLVEAPGIVIGRKGTLGKVIYLFENFYPIDTTYFVKSKFNSFGMFYEYFLLKTMNFLEMNSDSAVPGLNRDIALSSEIKIPSGKIISQFNNQCSTLFQKIKSNVIQIKTLTKLRDTLLPKLMSGEIRLN